VSFTPQSGSVALGVTLDIGAEGANGQLSLNYDVSARGVRVAAKFTPVIPEGHVLALSGDVVFLQSKSLSRVVDVEGKVVRARWNDLGELQRITIVAEGVAPGHPISHGAKVALKAITGKTEAELLVHGLVPDAIGSGISGGGDPVQAVGSPADTPLWRLIRAAGEGKVYSNDDISFEALDGSGRKLSMTPEGAVVAMASSDSSKFQIKVKERPAPPRVGFRGRLTDGFEDVEWFGLGPHEAYIDRQSSARVGQWKGSILDQTFKYVRPQENGNKLHTRWMALERRRDAAGCAGLLIAAEAPHVPGSGLGMQCHRYNIDDFGGPEDKLKQQFKHAGELESRAETDFCVDAAQMGVGGIDSWGRKPLPEHMINPGDSFQWTFSLRPFTSEEAPADRRALALSALAQEA